MDLIRVTDELYNTLIDRCFYRSTGMLAFVLDTTPEELLESDWREYLEEESLEDFLEEYMKRLNSRVVHLEDEQEEEEPAQRGKWTEGHYNR